MLKMSDAEPAKTELMRGQVNMKDRMLLERLVMLYYTIVEEFKPSRHLLYILQDFRGRFSFCPCGFFCPECLMMDVCYNGPSKGILNHIFYHSLLGTIYFRLKEKETEAIIL